jgi:hypothetical protein
MPHPAVDDCWLERLVGEMTLPKPLQGDGWSASTARRILPLLVAYAEACRPVEYGELSREVVRRRWGHYVMPVAFRYPAGAIGFALEETEEEWEDTIPPIGALSGRIPCA